MKPSDPRAFSVVLKRHFRHNTRDKKKNFAAIVKGFLISYVKRCDAIYVYSMETYDEFTKIIY